MSFYIKVLCLLLGTLILNTTPITKNYLRCLLLGGGFSNRGKGLLSTLYTLHFALHTPYSTLYTLHFTLHVLHCTLHFYFIVFFTFCAPHSTLYTSHRTMYTLHSIIPPHHTLRSTHTPHFALRPLPHSTVYCALVWQQGKN